MVSGPQAGAGPAGARGGVCGRCPGKPQGYFSAWPEYFHSFGDQVGQEPRMRRPLPSPRMITEAEAALLWLRWLEKDDARIVWLRANRMPWKKIGWEVGLSRPAANRHLQYGLALITGG